MSRQNIRKVSITKSEVIAHELPSTATKLLIDKMIEEQERNKINEHILNLTFGDIEDALDEQANELLDRLFSKVISEASKRIIPNFFVKLNPAIDESTNLICLCTYQSTKINKFNFERDCFNEVIPRDKYCHHYFDFDHIESNEQYTQVITQLDSLVIEFEQYSIGKYSNDPVISSIHNLKYISDAAKKMSIHVVFYENRILQADMKEIVKKIKNQNAKRYYYDINKFIDDYDYKLKQVGKSSRQIFRHILSKKIFRGKGSIFLARQLGKENDESFNQIVQCIQDDSTDDVITKRINITHKVPSLKEKEKQETKTKRLADVVNGSAELGEDGKIITETHVKNIKIDDIDYDDKLIIINKEKKMCLLNKFELTFENLEKTTGSFRYFPHIQEFIKKSYTE
ncbi:MAG: hypothetical protein EZS28_008719 [Streblomastix strix]|uniref:Uncharacterized protein n=1 Tax=Streblomastix strix TaxID=222440 RepID=A0A5J4WLQ3_9EUKA|nr:MAG: hypothetical protein EZS28_008719 [Streblomastix strix]